MFENKNKLNKVIMEREENNNMNVNYEVGRNIKFTDENGTRMFYEGDEIICCLRDNIRFEGKIELIGEYTEEKQTEPELAMYLDTSKSKTSRSGEIIKLADVTYICKNPLAENRDNFESKEESDKNTFVNVLTSLGYDKQKSENVYNIMKNVIKLYNIPINKATACAVYAIENKCDIKVPLKDMCDIDFDKLENTANELTEVARECSAMSVKTFENLINIYKEAVRCGEKDIPTFDDILKMVSDNWNNIFEEDRVKILNLLAQIKPTAAI